MDLFGFDDGDGPQDRGGDGGGSVADGGSSYKIKYFGFDDMSDSDGADHDDGGSSEETRRDMKAPSPKATPVVTIDEVLDLDPPESPEPPDPFERLRLKEKPAAREDKKSSDKLESRSRTGAYTDARSSSPVVMIGVYQTWVRC